MHGTLGRLLEWVSFLKSSTWAALTPFGADCAPKSLQMGPLDFPSPVVLTSGSFSDPTVVLLDFPTPVAKARGVPLPESTRQKSQLHEP